jgi:metallo-beta-lactamase class B
MYLVSDEGVVMFDTQWDTTQFQPMLDSITARHNKNVIMSFATHFHEDRTGGLAYYRQKRIKTYTTKKTDELSASRGMKRAEFLMEKDTTFNIGGYLFRVIYPGEGHAPDNIVIWFEEEKILYGGCLVKSTADKSLGNLGDANVKEYAATIRKVINECRDPEFVIPGHNSWADPGSLRHTLEMAEEL